MRSLPQHLSKVPVGREKVSREVLVSFQRERVLVAATGVFAKRGYQKTTVGHIVAAARISVGNFYQHFDNKEDCFLAAFDGIVEGGRERLAESSTADMSWSARAYGALAKLLEIYVEDPLAARVVLVEAQTAGEAATARYNLLVDAAASWLRQGRREYPHAGRLPETFEQAAVAGTAYFLHQRLLKPAKRSASQLLGETAPVILEPIIGAAEMRKLEALVISG